MDEDIVEIKLDPVTVSSKASAPAGAPSGQPPRTPLGISGRFGWLRSKKLWSTTAVVLLVLGVVLGWPLFRAYSDGRVAYQQALTIKDALKASDLVKTRLAMATTRAQVAKVHRDLSWVGWARFLPFLGGYISDGLHLTAAADYGLEAGEIVIAALEPYADILGLKGQGTFTGGTAEDRIATAIQTLDKVTPQVDQVAGKIKQVRQEVDSIDPNRYPENFSGKAVRAQVQSVKDLTDLIDDLLTEARPMVKQLPELLGANGEKKYLVLFQNDKELRPTGGFITAYATFRVEKGKIHLGTSDDIYKLDDTLTRHVTPPAPISKYLNVFGWRLRDSNFSPDFPSSMRVFSDLYASSTAKENINGIIAMDTHVLLTFLDLLSPIKVYGTEFTTKNVPACDCPMVIYELEKYADEPKAYERGSRKDIIGVLLSAMMEKAMSSGRNVYGPLFQGALEQSRQKHILFYLHNTEAQKGIEALGFGGAIKTYDGDYLHVNDANLAGAKSNLYVVASVKQDVTVTDAGADVNLALEYRYPHDADNCSLERKEGLCLAGIYRDYLRVYLPKGATISEARGFENKSTTFEDLGHTVVDGFFTVVPRGLAKIQIQYQVAGDFKKNGVYKSLIQKQPGTVGNHYTVTVNGKKQEFNLTEDKELSVKL